MSASLEDLERELGPSGVLHNTAATKGRDLAAFFAADEDYALETWREVMGVNLDAMFLVAQETGKLMLPRRAGLFACRRSDRFERRVLRPRRWRSASRNGSMRCLLRQPAALACQPAARPAASFSAMRFLRSSGEMRSSPGFWCA